MKIAIVGSGNMGRTLGGAWAHCGHDIIFGSRSPEKAASVAQIVGLGTRGFTNQEAIAASDVVFLTARILPSEFLSDPSILAGKVVLDCTNRPPGEKLTFSQPDSLSFPDMLAANAPEVSIAKIVNTMAQEVFDNPPDRLRETHIAGFYCGHEPAKSIARQLLADLGLEPIDCGGLHHAWMLEAAGDLIRYILIGQQRWTASFVIADAPVAPPRFGGRQATDYSESG